MPPTELTQTAVIAHLSRLLGAIAMRSRGSEIRISQSVLDQIRGETPARALFESYDPKTDQVVLTFRRKSLATYLVEEAPTCTPAPTLSATPTTQPSHEAPVGSTPGRPPLTDQELASIEQKARAAQVARRLRREASRTPPPSSNPLDGIL